MSEILPVAQAASFFMSGGDMRGVDCLKTGIADAMNLSPSTRRFWPHVSVPCTIIGAANKS